MQKIVQFCIGAGIYIIHGLVHASPQTPSVSPTSPNGPVASAAQASDPLAFSSLIQLTLGMLLVLSLIIGIAWLLKRSGRFQFTAGGSLRILGGLSMGTRERVVLLQVGETQLLVGVAPGSVKTLHVLDKPLSKTEQPASGFSRQLGNIMNKGKAS